MDNLLAMANAVGFFPQLVAAPIERAGHLLSQLEAERKFDAVSIRSGLVQQFRAWAAVAATASPMATTPGKRFARLLAPGSRGP